MTKIYLDTSNLDEIVNHIDDKRIMGFTTNPTLMRNAGVKNYKDFAQTVMTQLRSDQTLSLEVFSDSRGYMVDQAHILQKWASEVEFRNLYVKIPIMTTEKEPTVYIIDKMLSKGLKINITAITTIKQIKEVMASVRPDNNVILSVFAGRIADTGRDAFAHMRAVHHELGQARHDYQTLWASSREIYNFYEADKLDVDIITLTPALYSKLSMHMRDLETLSQETVKMFVRDGEASGLEIE